MAKLLPLLIFAGCAGSSLGMPRASAAGPVEPDPHVASAVLALFERSGKIRPDLGVCEKDSALAGQKDRAYCELNAARSPQGFRIRNRYEYPGILIAEALAANPDPDFRKRLVEVGRWDREPEVRSAALVALGRYGQPEDFKLFQEAVAHLEPGVRFGAMEALYAWGLAKPENTAKAEAMLKLAAAKDARPILRVYADAVLNRFGDPEALDRLRGFLDDSSWLVRSMAARYLGEFGEAEDYSRILKRLGNQQGQDFALAEFCVSALKLFPKHKAKEEAKKAPPPAPVELPPGLALLDDPIEIRAPMLKIKELIDPQIRNHLLRLLTTSAEARPDDQQSGRDAQLDTLSRFPTITGFKLRIRYTELGFLLTEALAGTQDPTLQRELERIARSSTNDAVRATAIVALSYGGETRWMSLIQELLRDDDLTVRLGAFEALLRNDDGQVEFELQRISREDPSLMMKTLAAREMWARGDEFGRVAIEDFAEYQDDWLPRAMAAHAMRLYGKKDAYWKLFRRFDREDNEIAKAEAAAALLTLQRHKEE